MDKSDMWPIGDTCRRTLQNGRLQQMEEKSSQSYNGVTILSSRGNGQEEERHDLSYLLFLQ